MAAEVQVKENQVLQKIWALLSSVTTKASRTCHSSTSAALDTEVFFPVFLLAEIANGVQKSEGMAFEVAVVTIRGVAAN